MMLRGCNKKGVRLNEYAEVSFYLLYFTNSTESWIVAKVESLNLSSNHREFLSVLARNPNLDELFAVRLCLKGLDF